MLVMLVMRLLWLRRLVLGVVEILQMLRMHILPIALLLELAWLLSVVPLWLLLLRAGEYGLR